MITENGYTAELACVTAYRPAWPGHSNNFISPRLFTIHSIEDGRSEITDSDTELMIGPAGSNGGIMGDNWLSQATTQSSVHFGVYPGGVAQCLPLNRGCWGAGPSANGVSIQAEQSGVAAYTTAQWLTTAGQRQLGHIAELYAQLCVKFGWRPHWATDAEIIGCVDGSLSGGFGGATYHHDWTRRYPRDTTHTDPGSGYPGKADGPYTAGQRDPQDKFMPLALAFFAALTGGLPVKPAGPPPPVRPPALPNSWDEIMATTGAPATYAEVVQDIANAVMNKFVVVQRNQGRHPGVGNDPSEYETDATRVGQGLNYDGSRR